MVMVAEYGKLSLKDVLEPAIQMAEGYPIEAQAANAIERQKHWIKQWPYSKAVFLPHLGQEREVHVHRERGQRGERAEEQDPAGGRSRSGHGGFDRGGWHDSHRNDSIACGPGSRA